MSMKKIKITGLDKKFSDWIRHRDNWTCQRCKHVHNKFSARSKMGLHCSHFFGRARKNTRFDPQNCDALCAACHRIWGSDNYEAYRDFKIKQLGEKGFQALNLRANTSSKPDYNMINIWLTNELKKIKKEM